jgi:nucleotide-binding universal stress UspA family protein
VHAKPAHPEPGPEAGRVVVGMDGSEFASSELLAFAFEEAAWRRTGHTALHAWQEPRDGLPLKGETIPEFVHGEVQAERRRLAERVGGWQEKYPHVDVRHVVLEQSPAAALLAASTGAELVVVGSHASARRQSLLLGSVSQELLHDAQCPVAVVGCHSTEAGTESPQVQRKADSPVAVAVRG